MNTERWTRLEQIFLEASDLPGGEREAYLAAACGGDPELWSEASALLQCDGPAEKLFTALGSHLAGTLPPRITDSGMRAGPYVLEHPIGSGGMGDVFAARRVDDQFSKKVAVKVTRLGLGQGDLARRFRKERQILASLEHPNIARLLDGGILENGCPFMAMEFVDGEPIDQWVKRNGLTGAAILPVLLPVFSAAAYAHANLVVHCDLKPGNILVQADGVPKLLDFGVARLLRDEDSAVTSFALTPRYAAPELRMGQAATVASDVYSLGVLIRELCAPEAGGELALIATKASEAEPPARYASVDALRNDVECLLAGRPISARAPTLGYRAGKYVRRHRAGVIAAGLALIALAASAVLIVRQSRDAQRERRKAEEVSGFLLEIIGAANPARGGSLAGKPADLKLIDLLDDYASRAGGRFANEPDLEIRMRSELANAYTGIQQFSRAREQAQLALDLARRVFGDDSQQAALAYYRLGSAATSESRFAEGEGFLRQAILRWERLRAEDSQIVMARASLADALSGQGKAAESLRAYLQVFEFHRQRSGESSIETATAANNVAYQYYSMNDLPRFREWIERSVAMFRRAPDPPVAFGSALNNLAQVAFQERDYPKAIATMEEAVRFWRKRYTSVPHVDLGTGLANTAIMRTTAGQPGGTALAAEAVSIYRRLFAADSIEVGHGLYALGMSQCADGGPLEQGAANLRTSVAIRAEKLPANDGRTASSAFRLGECLIRLGRPIEAVPQLEAAVAIRSKNVKPDDQLLREMNEVLARAHSGKK